ncbi:MAG: tetratricopeptide repeat protein [Spirochaetaceae bacterium]
MARRCSFDHTCRVFPGSGTLLLLLLGAAIIGFAGCSSAPDPPEAVYDTRNRASRYVEFGNAHFNDAEYDMALRLFELALEENTTVDNQPGIASNHNSIGRVYLAVGRSEAAESNFLRARAVAERHDAPEALVQAHSNLAELYLYRDETDLAAAELEKAQAVIAAEQLAADPIVRHNLAVVQLRRGELDEAAELLRGAAEQNEEARAWAELASNHYMLAAVESRRENLQAAVAEAEAALAYDKRAENSPGIAKDLFALGSLHRRAGDSDKAYDYLQRATRVTIALNQFEETRRNLRVLTELAREVGDEEAAREYQRQLELLNEEEEAFVSTP